MIEAGWTREPKQEGYYWWRKGNELEVLHVWECSYLQVSQMQTDEGFGSMSLDSFIRQYGGEWLGPITPDSYQHGRAAGARECVEKVRARAALWRAHGGAKIGFPYGHLTVEGECDSIADELGKFAQQAQEEHENNSNEGHS